MKKDDSNRRNYSERNRRGGKEKMRTISNAGGTTSLTTLNILKTFRPTSEKTLKIQSKLWMRLRRIPKSSLRKFQTRVSKFSKDL